MIRAFPLLIALCLPACSTPSTQLVAARIELPALPSSIAAECPPAEQVRGATLGELALADARLATLYAMCRDRHREAVAAYARARATGE